MDLQNLDTPALLVDLDIMEANLRQMSDYSRRHNLRLCPHTKTHKIPALAQCQISLGAERITVAKIGEAEVMAKNGIRKMLLAYPAYGPEKWKRLASLAQNCELTISLDSFQVAQGIAQALQRVHATAGILVEVDVGFHRCGVQPDEAVSLARRIVDLPGVEFEGVMFFPGHIKNPEQEKDSFQKFQETIRGLMQAFEKAGLRCRTVSGGSTPTAYFSHELEAMNEIRPGTYIFNDANEVNAGVVSLEMCAARVLARVVSMAVPGQMIVDGGSKTLSSARSWIADDKYFGWIWGDTEARLRALNEEHGYVDLSRASRTYRVGDLVQILPNHICECVNLHERIYGLRKGEVEVVWEVEARGKLT